MNDNEYFDDEEFREILEDYERAVKSGQPVFMDADDLADIADYYQLNNRFDEADQAIDLALKLQPDSTTAIIYRVRDLINEGKYEEAEATLDKIIERQSPEYVYTKAEIMLAQEKVDEADAYLRECLKDIPPDEYQDYVLDVANLYTDYSYGDKSMEWMMRAKQENTEDFKELMARTLFDLGKYKDSERIFNELLDANPFQKRYWNALSNVQFMNEDYNAAVTSSEYAIAIDPKDPEAIISKANGLYRLENYEEALKFYIRYSEKVPDDEFGLLHQGMCLINMGCYQEAAKKLEEAEAVSPQDSPYISDICQELAFTYSELGRTETALSYIGKAWENDADHADLLVIKGHILLHSGDVEAAETAFKEAFACSEDSSHTMLRIIVSLYDNQYVESAYEMFQKYFNLTSRNFDEGYAYMTLCCWDLKRYDEFMHYLKLACEKNPQETRLVLSHMFPDSVKPQDYYKYMLEKLKN